MALSLPLLTPAPVSRCRRLVDDLLAHADITIDGERPCDLRVHDQRFFRHVLARGSLGFGEAYVAGWFDCPRLDQAVTRLLRAGVAGRRLSLADIALVLSSRVLNRQNPMRAGIVGEHHYDREQAIYRAMLDSEMIYSCGYWAHAHDLEAAQRAKLALVFAKLDLQPGMRVLDIGCGWGGAARRAALDHGVEVVGITISQRQAEIARERCVGLPVEIRLQDYRDLDERFDRIYSLGMFEHVGHKNHRRFMQVARRALAPGGRLLLHTIGGNRSATCLEPWLDRHIFPNATLPSAAQLAAASEGLFVIEDWHAFGPDYDRTLMAWHERLQDAWDSLPGAEDRAARREWSYYLLACAGSFRARKNQLWQVLFTPHGVKGGLAPVR